MRVGQLLAVVGLDTKRFKTQLTQAQNDFQRLGTVADAVSRHIQASLIKVGRQTPYKPLIRASTQGMLTLGDVSATVALKMRKDLSKVTNAFSRLSKVGRSFLSFLFTVTGPVFIFKIISDDIQDAINAMSRGEIALRSLVTVYGSTSRSWVSWSQQMRKETGVAASEWQQSAVRLASLQKNYKLTTEQLQVLAARTADVAVATGLAYDETEGFYGTIVRIESAIRGEAEAAERLNVNLQDNYMRQSDIVKQLGVNWSKLDEYTKAQIRYLEVLRQTNYAEGKRTEYAKTARGALTRLGTAFRELIEQMWLLYQAPIAQFFDRLATRAENASKMITAFAAAYKPGTGRSLIKDLMNLHPVIGAVIEMFASFSKLIRVVVANLVPSFEEVAYTGKALSPVLYLIIGPIKLLTIWFHVLAQVIEKLGPLFTALVATVAELAIFNFVINRVKLLTEGLASLAIVILRTVIPGLWRFEVSLASTARSVVFLLFNLALLLPPIQRLLNRSFGLSGALKTVSSTTAEMGKQFDWAATKAKAAEQNQKKLFKGIKGTTDASKAAGKSQKKLSKGTKEATDASKDQRKEMGKNIQSFDEVHLIEEDAAESTKDYAKSLGALGEAPVPEVPGVPEVAPSLEVPAPGAVPSLKDLLKVPEVDFKLPKIDVSPWLTAFSLLNGAAALLAPTLAKAFGPKLLTLLKRAGKNITLFALRGAKSLWNFAKQVAKSTPTVLLNFAKIAWSAIVNAAKTAASWAVNALKGFLTFTGQVASSTITVLTDFAKIALSAVTNAAKTTVSWAVNALSGILTFVAQTALATGQVIVNFAKIAAAALVNAARVAASWFIALGPVGWVLGILALIVTLVALNWDKVKQKTLEIWGAVSGYLKEKWEAIKTKAIEIWEGIKTFFADTWEAIKTKAIEIWEKVKTFFADTWEAIKTKVIEIWEGIKTFFADTWEAIKTKVIEIWEGIKTFFADTWEAIKTKAIEIWEGIKTFFADTWKAIKTKVSEVWDGIKTYFIDTWNGIKSKAVEIWEKVKTFFADTWKAIKTKVSEVWDEVKTYFIDTWNGIKSKAVEIWEKVKTFFADTWKAIKTEVSEVWDGIKTYFIDTWNGIESKAVEIWEGIKRTAKEKWEGVKDAIKGVLNSIIDLINKFIRFWNKIEFEVPEVEIPGVGTIGGWTVGVPRIKEIPRLAEGGLVARPTYALVGEAGPEAVIPLKRRSVVRELASTLYNALEEELKKTQTALYENLSTGVEVTVPSIQLEPVAPTTAVVGGAARGKVPPVELHLHVGTLVADELGLKKLEQKLRQFRIFEDRRLGLMEG